MSPKKVAVAASDAPANEVNEMDPASVEVQAPYTADDLLREIVQTLRDAQALGRTPTIPLAKQLRALVIRGVLQETLETGSSSLPGGLGGFKLLRRPPNRVRTLPDGSKVTERRERAFVKFRQGVALKTLLGYEGNYYYKPKEGTRRRTGPVAPLSERVRRVNPLGGV